MKIVIAGAGEVGSHLAKMLSNESNEITVIDMNGERLQSLRSSADVITVEGNPSAIHVLREAGVGSADLFIAVNPSESQDVNIVSAMLAKKLGSKKATARINNEEYLTYENKFVNTLLSRLSAFVDKRLRALGGANGIEMDYKFNYTTEFEHLLPDDGGRNSARINLRIELTSPLGRGMTEADADVKKL